VNGHHEHEDIFSLNVGVSNKDDRVTTILKFFQILMTKCMATIDFLPYDLMLEIPLSFVQFTFFEEDC
jgi:hypothetical protein